MSNTPPEAPDYEEVEEGSPFGGAECEESSPEPQQTEDQDEANLYPFDSLAVEYYEEPGETSEQAAVENTVYDGHAPTVESTEQNFNESADTYLAFEADVQVNEQSYDPEDLQKTYNFDDFMYSNTSSFDEGSNSNFDENREEPKGSALGRFNKIAKAVEIAEYETLQVLYQLLFQRSAWDTQQILARRILEFSGFNFGEKSEDYFNREMMLRTQPNDMLVKIGAILGLNQIQRMLFDMDSGRADLISSIMYFLSKPNKTTHLGVKHGTAVATEAVTVPENSRIPPPKTPSKCGYKDGNFLVINSESVCSHKKGTFNCHTITMEEIEHNRKLLNENIGKNAQDLYLVRLISPHAIQRPRPRTPFVTQKNKYFVTYFLIRNPKKLVKVCKAFFLTALGLSKHRTDRIASIVFDGKMPRDGRGGDRRSKLVKERKEEETVVILP